MRTTIALEQQGQSGSIAAACPDRAHDWQLGGHHGPVRSEPRRRPDVPGLRLRRRTQPARLRFVPTEDVRFESSHRTRPHLLQQERPTRQLPRRPVAIDAVGQRAEPQPDQRSPVQSQRLHVGHQRQRGPLRRHVPPPARPLSP